MPPGQSHKLAAVPFVNKKGERSMKRVKVERYRAGKKPSYAPEEDEYYTTDDDEDEDEEELTGSEDESDDQTYERADRDHDRDRDRDRHSREYDRDRHHKDYERNRHHREYDQHRTSSRRDRESHQSSKHKSEPLIEYEEDDPRLRKLNRVGFQNRVLIESTKSGQLVISDEETEEEIKIRHKLARSFVHEPVGPVIKEEFSDMEFVDNYSNQLVRETIIDTDDLLGDFVPSGLCLQDMSKKAELVMESEFIGAIEKAKEEAIFAGNFAKKLEQDIKLENLKAAMSKGHLYGNDVSSDIEDDEAEYKAWKEREIERILEYRLEKLNLS